MRLSKPVRRRPPRRRTATESPTGKDNTYTDLRAIQLRLVHVRNSCLGVARRGVENVRDAAIGEEGFVHRHFEVGDGAVGGEDFAKVVGIDVLGELFDDDFGAARDGGGARAGVGWGPRVGAGAVGGATTSASCAAARR